MLRFPKLQIDAAGPGGLDHQQNAEPPSSAAPEEEEACPRPLGGR